MAEEIAIETREALNVVEVAAETRLWQIPKVLASGFETARSHIEGSGASVEGMPYARYLDITWSDMLTKSAFAQFLSFLVDKQKMQIGLFTSEALGSVGAAEGRQLPAGRYVTTIHRGAYHKVGETYRRVFEWANANGVRLADSSMENYIDDPTEMATEDVRTRIWIAVKD